MRSAVSICSRISCGGARRAERGPGGPTDPSGPSRRTPDGRPRAIWSTATCSTCQSAAHTRIASIAARPVIGVGAASLPHYPHSARRDVPSQPPATSCLGASRTSTSSKWTICDADVGASAQQRPRLLSDNGPSYVAGDLSDRFESRGVKHTRGKPYHPMTQGKIERWHLSLKSRILLDNYYLPGDLERAVADFVEPGQSHARRRPLRARRTHPATTRGDQTQDHRAAMQNALRSSSVKPNPIGRILSRLRCPPVRKSLATGKDAGQRSARQAVAFMPVSLGIRTT